jgi:endoglucanase
MLALAQAAYDEDWQFPAPVLFLALMRHHLLATLLILGSALTAFAQGAEDIAAANQRLGRGINLGNALEAPQEGEWGVTLKPEYFAAIKAAGFQSVRLPIKWSAHALADAPYTIEPAFFARIDWCVEQARSNKLNIVLNVHHYGEMDQQPDGHLPRLIALWEQIAARYRDQPGSVYFELLNEPHDKLVGAKWNETIPQLLAAVRKTNPTRAVIVGPALWNSIGGLDQLELPEDRHLILTIHYYEPHHFTHQGAPWAAGSEKWKGLKWTGSDEELVAVRKAFDKAAAWAKARSLPVYLGEFGAYQEADLASRVRWTQCIVREAEARGFAWSYWEFCAGFGAYDPQTDKWRPELKAALLGK